MHARNTRSHINRLQRYKKKLTYTRVYAIFLHFLKEYDFPNRRIQQSES